MLTLVMLGLLAAGVLAWYLESVKARSARWVALVAIIGFALFFVFSLITASHSGGDYS